MASRRTLTGGVMLCALMATFTLTSCSVVDEVTNTTSRDEDGEVDAANEDASVFDIRVGDCLNDASGAEEVTTTPIVPCDQPHDSEVYAAQDLPDGTFPGDEAVDAAAIEICTTGFAAFAGIDYDASALDFGYYLPTMQSWGSGDREVLCTIYDPSGQVSGSLAGAAR